MIYVLDFLEELYFGVPYKGSDQEEGSWFGTLVMVSLGMMKLLVVALWLVLKSIEVKLHEIGASLADANESRVVKTVDDFLAASDFVTVESV